MIYPKEREIRGRIAKLLYEVRIPANITPEDMAAAGKLLSHNIGREFKSLEIVFFKEKGEDCAAIKVELESRAYLKYLLEVVSEGITMMESFLLTKSIEQERRE
jgi:hypothetical protein